MRQCSHKNGPINNPFSKHVQFQLLKFHTAPLPLRLDCVPHFSISHIQNILPDLQTYMCKRHYNDNHETIYITHLQYNKINQSLLRKRPYKWRRGKCSFYTVLRYYLSRLSISGKGRCGDVFNGKNIQIN